MATKEVMVSAPLMVFFYDRTFISGAFREAWRLRRRWYIAYALTWIVLIALMIVNAGRGETVGFGRNISGITAWNYALTQSWAIIRYLQLSIWPSPLVFDYGINPIASLLEVLPQAVAVLALVAACFWAFFGKHPKAGWLGMLFLAVLAPTTTFIPVVTQVIAEHRMYLPLTAIVTGAVILGARFLGRKILWLGAPVVIIFIVLTIQRNVTYQGLDTLWLDVMAKYPKNARAYGNVGNNLIKAKRPEEALPYLKKALELQPQSGDYYNNVGYAYAQMRDYQKAVEYYSQVRNMTNLSTLGINYSFALTQLGRYAEAHHVARLLIKEHPERATSHAAEADIFFAEKNYAEAEPLYKKTLELDPTNATALNNLGNIKAAVTTPGHLAEALEYYKKAAQYAPDDATIQDNPARLLTMLGRGAEAVPYYEAELKAQPDATDARKGYAGALYDAGRYDDAAAQYKLYLQASPSDVAFVGRQAVDLMKSGQYAQALPIIQAMSDAVPNNVSNEFLLANNLMMLGRREDSLPHYQTALALAPSRVEIRQNYALALASAGRYADAIPQYEEVLKLAQLADQPYIRHNYALALEGAGRVDDAIAQEQEALRVNPNYEDAKKKLAELETRLKR